MKPLTEEQINNAQELELDVLVAEHVMGWKQEKCGHLYVWQDEAGNLVCETRDWEPRCEGGLLLVLERLREMDFRVQMHVGPNGYRAIIYTTPTREWDVHYETADAPTLPEAVCRCALLAILANQTPNIP